jgi:hypothetical protein
MLELDEIAEMLLDGIRCACDAQNYVEAHQLLERIVNDVLKGICYGYIFEKMNPDMTIALFLDNVLIVGGTSKIS